MSSIRVKSPRTSQKLYNETEKVLPDTGENMDLSRHKHFEYFFFLWEVGRKGNCCAGKRDSRYEKDLKKGCKNEPHSYSKSSN